MLVGRGPAAAKKPIIIVTFSHQQSAARGLVVVVRLAIFLTPSCTGITRRRADRPGGAGSRRDARAPADARRRSRGRTRTSRPRLSAGQTTQTPHVHVSDHPSRIGSSVEAGRLRASWEARASGRGDGCAHAQRRRRGERPAGTGSTGPRGRGGCRGHWTGRGHDALARQHVPSGPPVRRGRAKSRRSCERRVARGTRHARVPRVVPREAEARREGRRLARVNAVT
jgi:hypothetical protein